MKKTMITALCMLSSVAAISTATAVTAAAQKTDDKKVQKTITLKSQRGSNSRGGTDPNIKQDETLNDMNTRGSSQPNMRERSTRGVEAIELTAQKGETARGGADPNIKEDNAPNDINKHIPAPSNKGGKSKSKN